MTHPPDASSSRAAVWTWLIAAIGFVFAALCLASLTWDGSYYLVRILQEGTACVPHHRWLDHAIHAPVLWARAWVAKPVDLARVLGLACSAVPLLSLAACLAMLRERFARLRMWAVFGILLAPLPGQIVMVGEVTPALQAGWVGLAFVWCGCPWRWAPVSILAAAAMWGLHPVAIPLFALTSATALALGLGSKSGERRRLICWSALFAAAAVGKTAETVLLATDYERANLNGSMWLWESVSGFLLTPFAALIPAFAAAALEFRSGWRGTPLSARLQTRLWLTALLLGLVYGLIPGGWAGSLCYRKFGILVCAPLVLMAGMEAWRLRRNEPVCARAASAVTWPALVFAVTMAAMSLSWEGLLGSYSNHLAACPGPVLRHEALSRLERDSALNHWSATSLSLVLQGWNPEKVHVMDASVQRGRRGGFAICPQDDFDWNDRAFALSWIGGLEVAESTADGSR